ncbi:hypothetical protein [Paenibacillus sp. J22TS3]|uniref:hypothetical protein n=1 Tax=Paenibacillus sp. J22TS3 TaxID=2807192 RepID=UPI001B1250D7|nr:hypothetical protein [Paenibacillus sp. J22TS3]GIP23904.1 hypothetical protein J22TS3_41790 [Paenibacillus sp. J22TS3]
MKQKFSMMLLSLVVILGAAIPASALADVNTTEPSAGKLQVIQTPGGKLDPQGKLDYASAITAIVSHFNLSLDGYNFIKEPKVSDYFTKLQDSAWYSEAFIIAQVNGLSIPKDVQADQSMTREQYANLLSQAIHLSGNYPTIMRYNVIKDGDSITPAYMDSIQYLLNSGVSLLDDKLGFNPKSPVTQSLATRWLNESVDFIHRMQDELEASGAPLQDYTLNSQAMDDKINKITVSAAAPSPGYGLQIASISFDHDRKQAIIYTKVVQPKKGSLNAQVITQVSVTTYIPAGYKADLAVTQPKQPTQADRTTSSDVHS